MINSLDQFYVFHGAEDENCSQSGKSTSSMLWKVK